MATTSSGQDVQDVQGVQGVEIGVRIVLCLTQAEGPMSLGDLANAAGLHRSKAHRYLVSLCRSGLVEQDGRNGRYDLGAAALTIGLAAQGRVDIYRHADDALDKLHSLTEATVSAAVWGSHGPTIVRRKEALRLVSVNTRVGSIIPVSTSAAGRLFAAFLPLETIRPFVDREAAEGLEVRYMGGPVPWEEFFPVLIDRIRKTGFSRVQGDQLVGIDAIAAPVFEQGGELAMTLTVLGPHGTLDLAPDGAVAETLIGVANGLSRRLGYLGQ
ncbi:MAG: IclR family transcriptional regulator [Pigmentiphaga sp.]